MRQFIKRATRTRTRKAVTLAALMVMLSSSSALAYFVANYVTATGSVTGTVASSGGTPGPNQTAVTLTGTFTAGLAPDGVAHAVTIKATNNSGAPYLVKNTVATISVDSLHATAGCLASWFTLTKDPGSVTIWSATGMSIPAADNNTTLAESDSIAMPADMADNQASCEGATITIALSAP